MTDELGRGLIAINIMRAVSEYEHYVRHSLACGIDAVVVGAGLPLDLPELAREHPQVALIPILSDLRGVQLVVRKWERKGRLPEARAVRTPWLDKYLRNEQRLKEKAKVHPNCNMWFDCLSHCGIRSVHELMQWLLGGILPAGVRENEINGWQTAQRVEVALEAAQEEE